MNRPIAVIGAGAWGTSLAMILHRGGQQVRLWEYSAEYARVLRETRENPKFLPGVFIPEDIHITPDLGEAAGGCEEVVLVSPSQVLRQVVRRLAGLLPEPRLVITASKGIEQKSLLRMSEIVQAEWPGAGDICVLSGPSHAEEVSRGLPCSLVAASDSPAAAKRAQSLFSHGRVRVYTHPDRVGVELGGALKNVMAIAAGVVDGLELGDNAKAALITRGLAEMRRLGRALGAQPQTFSGLSGLGDLVVTCASRHSRNRRVGELLGRAQTLSAILNSTEMVAEGVETTRSAHALAGRHGVEMPITAEVYRILFEGLPPLDGLEALMQRPGRAEDDAAVEAWDVAGSARERGRHE